MDKFEFACFCAVLAIIAMSIYLGITTKSAKASTPAATEIPEYVMKCAKFGPYVCEEYTIYRVTRN